MPGRRLSRSFLALAALAAWLSSCRPSPSSLKPGDAENPIAPEFTSLWEKSGGWATFGPPLEPARRKGGVLRQTFLAVELIYDTRSKGNSIRLAPLGRQLGLAEPAVPPTGGQTGQYFPETGHFLYTGFAPFFDALGGSEIAGPPISEVRFRNGRITQYFENLGMVRGENASPSEVRLVALGLAAFPGGSTFGQEVDSVLLPGTILQRPFAAALESYGGQSILGQPLSDPYLAQDGALEQVYEGSVVFGEGPHPRDVRFRPIGREQGDASPPANRSYEAGTIYDETTGHNIQWAFADFYRDHRGRVLLGAPLEEARLDGARLVQRFENGELTYSYDLPADLAVQLAPLGEAYLAEHPAPATSPTAQPTAAPAPTESASASFGSLQVQVSLGKTVVAPSESQAVEVKLLDADGQPVSNVRPRVTWYGSTASGTQDGPPTDDEGRTALTLQVEGVTSFEIITVMVHARTDGESGQALVQYAIGWGPAR